MKIYKILNNKMPLIGALSALLFTACTDNFEDYNTNPYETTEEMLGYDNLSTGSFFVQMQRNVFPIAQQPEFGDEVYQTMQNLAGDVFSGYMGATNNWYSGANNTTYALIPQWYGQAFSRAFVDVMPAWNSIRNSAEEELPQVYAVATIVKIEALHRITDMYGPLPYLNFGSGALQNDYDSQQEIYYSFFDELNEAIEILTNFNIGSPDATVLDDYDYIYNGNVEQWIRFGNSLKLRLAIRIVDVDPSKAQTEAESAISHPMGVMTSASDIAALNRGDDFNYNHPLYIISHNFDDVRMGAEMESYLEGYNDPRIAQYFDPNQDGEYIGIRNGININSKSDYADGPFSNLNISANADIIWMNPAEVYFLRAEGNLRGWNMGGEARDLYEEGIRISFNISGASGNVEAYLSDGTSQPIGYTDPVSNGNSVGASSDLVSDITIQWDDMASFEKNLERIITQKWIAIYPDGQEAWSEFRRTGYPHVFPVVINNSGGLISTSEQIRRLPFPSQEYQNNSAGVNVGVSLLRGADNGGTRLWWDVN
ncbi:RagB/SusD family nutrient uptake outer membrane protein [Autumnicola musiva]|uniref:RagB/SusD family nutrient uptake outer membrane protein n=1 Tax=Autumnicola musiva TaxID=3075589 RepID=A0ABU3D1V1_9FLAO|nr:RagB/SusD family nutrient uptake outer membrane protein [Zunongwangia sp. F117]MDT0675459.1 RagB/SusD family nutrient uptake outer membrane protein [Zunongwangia sp. F117]